MHVKVLEYSEKFFYLIPVFNGLGTCLYNWIIAVGVHETLSLAFWTSKIVVIKP